MIQSPTGKISKISSVFYTYIVEQIDDQKHKIRVSYTDSHILANTHIIVGISISNSVLTSLSIPIHMRHVAVIRLSFWVVSDIFDKIMRQTNNFSSHHLEYTKIYNYAARGIHLVENRR